jgi:surfeit locus 1 family protein
MALAVLVAFATLLSLGVWQLERKAWKEGIIAQIEARAYGPALAAPPPDEWPRWSAAADEYRRVRLSGTFLHDKEVLVHGLMAARRGSPAQGFYVFTPFALAGGGIVMVNRGFVPTELRDPGRRAAGQLAGETTVTGLARAPETRGWFLPENEPARDSFFVRSLADMQAARSLAGLAPFYVDADATPNPGGWPRGGQTRLSLPNDHLQYALTWFGLALTLVGVVAAAFWRHRRAPAHP